MKVLLILTLVAIIYAWYLSKNKTFIKKSIEAYKMGKEKRDKRGKRSSTKSRKSRKRRKGKRRKKRR